MRDISLRQIHENSNQYLRSPAGRGERKRSKLLADRIGILASIFCAIHCAVTPIILLVAPIFGRLWSHPASHWGTAILVVPLACLTMVHGYRRHQKKWVIACGSLGISFLLLGAALPYLETSLFPSIVLPESNETAFVYVVGNESPIVECQDSCCPSILTHSDGTSRLNIPPASIVTTIGGIALILTHFGNLCCCRKCLE